MAIYFPLFFLMKRCFPAIVCNHKDSLSQGIKLVKFILFGH